MVVETAGIPSSFNWATVDAPDSSLTAKKTLTPSEKEEVKQLKALDKQVRDHEQEHLRAGGALVRSGGATFEYNLGPDGRLYAARGGVDVDAAPVKGDAQASIDKAAKIHKTALAAGLDASLQDRRVAAGADKMASNAYALQEAIKTTQTKLTQTRMAYSVKPHATPAVVNVQT